MRRRVRWIVTAAAAFVTVGAVALSKTLRRSEWNAPHPPRSITEAVDHVKELLRADRSTSPYGRWRSDRLAYERDIDSRWTLKPHPLVRQLRADPLSGPVAADAVARRLSGARSLEDALRAALGIAGLPEGEPTEVGLETRSEIEVAFRRAYEIAAAGRWTSPEDWKRPELSWLPTWLVTTGYRPEHAKSYWFGWRFRPVRPLERTMFETNGVGTPPAACSSQAHIYGLFRSLSGESVTFRPWLRAERRRLPSQLHAEPRGDIDALGAALTHVLPLLRPAVLTRLRTEELRSSRSASPPAGVEGDVHYVRRTPAGTICIAGTGPNRYRGPLPELLIDLGGDDVYDSSVGDDRHVRPLHVLIDLDGDDTYVTGTGGPGVGLFGIGLLWDLRGNDLYVQGIDPDHVRAQADAVRGGAPFPPDQLFTSDHARLDGGFAWGASLCGIGILVDEDGDDLYVADKWAFGAALGPGVAVLLDRNGSDRYVTAALGGGVGVNRGTGLLIDLGNGSDLYQCGGVYETARDDGRHEGMGAFAFGLGAGSAWRGETRPESGHRGWPTCSGGLGVLIDGGGSDTYAGSSFSIGCGYSGGAGLVVDRGGNDTYLPLRPEDSYYVIGTGCHRGTGVVLDVSGNDSYTTAVPGGGYGWDLSTGCLVDLAGADRYAFGCLPRFQPGQAGAFALGILIDAAGRDVVSCAGLGDASFLPPHYRIRGGNIVVSLLLGPERDRLPSAVDAKIGGPANRGVLPRLPSASRLPSGEAWIVAGWED